MVIAKTNADQTRAVVLALNCETDFAARNEGFIALTNKFTDIALEKFPATLEALLALPFEGSLTYDDIA